MNKVVDRCVILTIIITLTCFTECQLLYFCVNYTYLIVVKILDLVYITEILFPVIVLYWTKQYKKSNVVDFNYFVNFLQK